jgi:hypothetical protein
MQEVFHRRPPEEDRIGVLRNLRDAVGAGRHHPAVCYLDFPVELKQPLGVATVLLTEAALTEDKHHRIPP